jgi:uncharacterized protein YeeX (DUF496 family)
MKRKEKNKMKRETNGLDRRIETNERTVQVLRYKQEQQREKT